MLSYQLRIVTDWPQMRVPGDVCPQPGPANAIQRRLAIELTGATGAFTGPKHRAFAALHLREAP